MSHPRSMYAVFATVLLVLGCGKDGTGVDVLPTISAVSPDEGTVGTELTITGTGFQAGAQVLVGALVSTTVEVSGSTQIFATVPSGVTTAMSYDVTVRNNDGGEVVQTAAFTPVAPFLQFVNSATKPSGNTGSTIIVEGDAFGDAQGTGQILFSDGAGGTVAATIAGVDDWTNTFIVTTVPSSAATGPILVETGTGQSVSLTFTVTQNAVFSPSSIAWGQTQDLPNAMSGHDALAVSIDDAGGNTVQYVFTTGGAGNDEVPMTGIYSSRIQTDGTISGWNDLGDLGAGRAFHTSVAATPFNSKTPGSGFLFVIGGVDDTGQPTATVTQVTLNNDGTIGSQVAASALPVPLHSTGAVLFRSSIYVVGGATTGDVPVSTVYRAQLDTLGTLGAWEEVANGLPSARAYHSTRTFGGYIYTAGGETGTVPIGEANFTNNATKLGEVIYSRIDLRTGEVGSWTVNASEMQKSRSKHSMLVAGGNMFVSAGLYAGGGSGSSENISAQINSDGTVGSFGGATGSNTLQSLGGVNLFNHAAIGYVDAAGVAHVMVLGGDDLNNPGSKQSKVMFY